MAKCIVDPVSCHIGQYQWHYFRRGTCSTDWRHAFWCNAIDCFVIILLWHSPGWRVCRCGKTKFHATVAEHRSVGRQSFVSQLFIHWLAKASDSVAEKWFTCSPFSCLPGLYQSDMVSRLLSVLWYFCGLASGRALQPVNNVASAVPTRLSLGRPVEELA